MDSKQSPPQCVIFDLGDVLFTWSADTNTAIPSRTLRKILSSPTWHDYERGQITRATCYEQIALEYSIPASEITEAFAQARESLQPDRAIVSFLEELKKNTTTKIYAMSNIGKEDFAELATKMDPLLFDYVFTSAAAGMRKPELGFYNHVLDSIGLTGEQVIFVDDKEENVLAAQELGIQGLVFEESTIQTLRDTFDVSICKGWKYLSQNATRLFSETNTGVVFDDNFAQLLILDTLQDQGLVDLKWKSKETWNFFQGKTALIPSGVFPDDLDTTSLALAVLTPSSTDLISSLLDKMATYVNSDGTFQTYFERDRPRVDVVVSANILACFYAFDRGHEFERTLQLVHSLLLDRTYMEGTRYYPSPDCCLGFIGRLLRSSSDPHLHATLSTLLESRVRERVGLAGSALDLAMRIITCQQLEIECEEDCRTLSSLQREDGSWEVGWMYRYGSTGVKIGNCGVTTAMAVKALSGRHTNLEKNGVSETDAAKEIRDVDDIKEITSIEVVSIPSPGSDLYNV